MSGGGDNGAVQIGADVPFGPKRNIPGMPPSGVQQSLVGPADFRTVLQQMLSQGVFPQPGAPMQPGPAGLLAQNMAGHVPGVGVPGAVPAGPSAPGSPNRRDELLGGLPNGLYGRGGGATLGIARSLLR